MHNRSASRASFFVQHTAIHGIKELLLIKNKSVRFLWVFVLIGCFCGVTYEIYQIVHYYRSNPSASQVKWVMKEVYNYPPMVFCPKTFLSLEKVKRLNMSKNALAYTVSLFQPVHQEKLPAGFQLDKAREEVKRIMQRNNLETYLDLFSAIAFDGKDVMYDALTGKKIKLEVYVPGYGLCYRIHLPPIKASSIKSINRLELEHIPSEKLTEYDFIHDATLLVRDTTGVKADMIMLSKKAFYQINFHVQLFKRLNTASTKCLNPDEMSENYYVADCELACLDLEKVNSGCSDCLPYQLLNHFNKTVEPCADIRTDNADVLINKRPGCDQDSIIARSKGCLSGCIPVCEQWMFKHSTLIFENHNSSMYIRLLYNPSDGILTYEEVPTYNFDTFISNIGGQLGLWLGASVVSIFQIFYYACMAMFKRQEEKDVSKMYL